MHDRYRFIFKHFFVFFKSSVYTKVTMYSFLKHFSFNFKILVHCGFFISFTNSFSIPTAQNRLQNLSPLPTEQQNTLVMSNRSKIYLYRWTMSGYNIGESIDCMYRPQSHMNVMVYMNPIRTIPMPCQLTMFELPAFVLSMFAQTELKRMRI